MPSHVSSLVLALSVALASVSALAADEKPKVPSMQEILDASPKADWRTLDPDRTLYMQLPAGRVIIELAPDFAPEHVANIRTLAKEGYWDGLFVIRSQDNYVAQWGDAEEDVAKQRKKGTAKPKLPAEFERNGDGRAVRAPARQRWLGAASRFLRRLPRRARSEGGQGVARALLWHGRCRAATSTPTAATARRCTPSPGSRRACSTATSRSWAASCRASSC